MMSRRSFACLVVTALAVAALLVTAEPASAQQRGQRGGGGFGYAPGTGLNFGYGNAYGYGNPYYGGGYYNPWQYSYGRGSYPGYYGYGWNTPAYRWSEGSYNWNPTYYSGVTPSYYSQGMEGDSYGSPSGARYGQGGESYGAMSGGGVDNHVFIGVNVPPNAEIWFEDQKTSQTGNFRTFISPPLQEDKNFVYHIRARWTEDGRQVEKERKLEVHPGDRLFVNFMKPRPEGTGGQFGTQPDARGGDRSLERRDRTLEDTQRNRQENADRALDNRTQPRTPTTNPPRTGTENQGETSRPPDKP